MTIQLTKKTFVGLFAVLGLSGCGSMDVPDLNNPSLDDFRERPTRPAVLTAATGLLVGHRAGVAAPNGYVAQLGIIGREAYVFDPSDPRSVNELLGPTLDPGGPAFGGNHWTNPYLNIRNANALLDSLDKVPNTPDTDKEGLRGFAKTIQALDFLVVINTRDTHGAPIDVNLPVGQLAPIVGKEAVFERIAALLNEGHAHLANAGDAFPFQLSPGFAGFNTPTTFQQFNRALAARVAVYRGRYAEALTALSQSFLNQNAPLDQGVFHAYGTNSGDTDNGLISVNVYAHPSNVTDAELQEDGTVDDRVNRKLTRLAEAKTEAGGKLRTEWRFRIYPSNNSPVPIIRNEELILLRAEANIGERNFGPAADDLNFIRTTSGRLPPKLDITEDNALDELLKQKRFSLLFEGGHRWIDLRRYGRLDTLPREIDAEIAPHERFPIPAAEMDARQ
ncbi:RagB/SusD family nutrient uptake outer membrane protein [Myxococcus sp. AM009]|uniref:RagB/SusD family nutrient uptake outer membrane protein n=1 Tax=unclassified Myxococcus TaxID=2648731 RepID=UPI001595CF39|nr:MULTISPECIES: RagB/SusD family nutrient uptake outer membrane protein [unclassified Myxococcus]NVI98160.1 RagB/SusD family nutrient uptake outer membrane protein [Myxococcus sp. AM009]NVJ16214.1 RagB/SusD family nutrient uptake outer membrane protein [Myxococcus sp. AM010]